MPRPVARANAHGFFRVSAATMDFAIVAGGQKQSHPSLTLPIQSTEWRGNKSHRRRVAAAFPQSAAAAMTE